MKKPTKKGTFFTSLPVMLLSFFLYSCASINKIDVEFPQKPCLIPENNFSFTLCGDFPFTIDGKRYVVPQGFHTDLTSVPWMFGGEYIRLLIEHS